jgi:hypothetical protein
VSFLPFVGWNVERFDPWASNRRSLRQASGLTFHGDDPFRACFSLGQAYLPRGLRVDVSGLEPDRLPIALIDIVLQPLPMCKLKSFNLNLFDLNIFW